jgi:5-methylthioribose kinase
MGVVKSAAAVVRVPGEYLALAQTRQKASWHQLSRQAVSVPSTHRWPMS